MTKSINVWRPELVIGDHNTSKTVYDLNPYSIATFLSGAESGSVPRGIWKQYCENNVDKFVPSLQQLALSLASHVSSFSARGRLTILRSIHGFLRFQAQNSLNVGTKEGLQEYIQHLKTEVITQICEPAWASSRLSTINQFLVKSGQLSTPFKYLFPTKRGIKTGKVTPYTDADLSTLISVAFTIYDSSKDDILSHIDACTSGQRNFSLSALAVPHTYELSDQCQKIDYISRNPISNMMVSAFFIFSLYTWSNKSQVIDIDADDLSLDDKTMDSALIYKGRAQKFIRLTIGTSTIEGERSGYKWLSQFLTVRKRLLLYLQTYEGMRLIGNPLFFTPQDKGLSLARFTDTRINAFNKHPLVTDAKRRGIHVPTFDTRRLRKTVEQLTDRSVLNPLVITEKAQHGWDTYKLNYAHGNPRTSRVEMSAALKALQDAHLGAEPLEARQHHAAKYGISLVTPNPDTTILLNGLGCRSIPGISHNADTFIRKQEHFGRSPKVCADFSNCLDCDNCALVEDIEAIYNLISFRKMLALAKRTYIPSAGAINRYENMIDKIDLRLVLVDEQIMAIAMRKLNGDGVSKAWLF